MSRSIETSDAFIQLPDLGDWVPTSEGMVQQEVAMGEALSLVKAHLDEDAVAPRHQHQNEQLTMVLEGQVLVSVGDEERQLVTGEVFHASPGVEHSIKALEESLIVSVFNPPRGVLKH